MAKKEVDNAHGTKSVIIPALFKLNSVVQIREVVETGYRTEDCKTGNKSHATCPATLLAKRVE